MIKSTLMESDPKMISNNPFLFNIYMFQVLSHWFNWHHYILINNKVQEFKNKQSKQNNDWQMKLRVKVNTKVWVLLGAVDGIVRCVVLDGSLDRCDLKPGFWLLLYDFFSYPHFSIWDESKQKSHMFDFVCNYSSD